MPDSIALEQLTVCSLLYRGLYRGATHGIKCGSRLMWTFK